MDKLQWGNRKRLRCFKVKDSTSNGKSDGGRSLVVKKKVTSRLVDNNKESGPLPPPMSSPHRLNRDLGVNRSNANEHRKTSVSSPEEEDRYYTTRGSVGMDDSSKLFMESKEEKKKLVWPKLLITLSSKEKEEDFMAMKGCKLPQRPKKRAKLIQRTILLVQPGTWLQDLCQERYEVREKKTSTKVLHLLSSYCTHPCQVLQKCTTLLEDPMHPFQILHSKDALLLEDSTRTHVITSINALLLEDQTYVSDPPLQKCTTFGGFNTYPCHILHKCATFGGSNVGVRSSTSKMYYFWRIQQAPVVNQED